MEEKVKREEIISEEEFTKRLSEFQVYNPKAVNAFRSTGRAARRGHLLKSGMIVPSRPNHNRKNSSKRKGVHSRKDNELKKEMWQIIKETVKDGIQQQEA